MKNLGLLRSAFNLVRVFHLFITNVLMVAFDMGSDVYTAIAFYR